MMTDLLLFRIGRELFATELRAVEEAVDLAELQQVSGTPSAVRRVCTLRGAFVPLFSPAAALGVAASGGGTALVVRDTTGRIALEVDDVEDVLHLSDGELRPPPPPPAFRPPDARDAPVVRGVVRRGSNLVTVVDLEALIAACRGRPQPEAA
jgi:purine-binding chemotaxis protein CheW